MIKELKLYRLFIKTYLKTKIEYRFAILIETIANMINIGSFYAFLSVVFIQISAISGWNYYEALFLVSLNWLCTSICGFFLWTPMITMGQMIKDGSFDSLLIRPLSPFKYCVYRQFQYTFIGRLLIAVFFLVYSISRLNIHWNVINILLFIVVVISGSLIHGAVLIILGALSFWVIDNTEIMNIVASYDGVRTLIDFPISAFDKSIQLLFTFILPYAFVNFYPSVYFLNKESTDTLFAPVFQYLSPVVAIVFYSFAVFIWNSGLKRYSGAGS